MKRRAKNIFGSVIMTGLLAASLTGCDDAPAEITPDAETPKAETTSIEPLQIAAFQAPVQARLDAGYGVGIAMSIIDQDTEHFILKGLANQDTGQAISRDSLFEIGSITKTFTGILLADMVVRGEVNLDDPVSKFLPDDVTMPDYDGTPITLLDLVTHRSSLPPMPDNFTPADMSNPYADYTPAQMYAFLSGYKLKKPIGSNVEYSNLGMGLLGHVLARHSGLSYEALVTERILEPLGMRNTFMVVPDPKKPDFAIGHNAAMEPTSYWDINTLSGAGALRSDINDMTLYLRANMGLIETDLDEAIQLSHEKRFGAPSAGGSVGLAWFTQTIGDKTVVWHNGGTGGFRTFMGFDTAHKRGVMVLANAQDDPDLIGRAVLTDNPESIRPDEIDPDLIFTEVELEKFVGEYQLAPTFSITITRKDTKLFGQATGQDKFQLFPKSRLEFFLKVVDASIIFTQDESGEITSLTLDQAGMMQPAKKI